jgi:probable phosphoglycerate mutase
MPFFLALARHGETADNARAVFQGQAGSKLNRLGRAQAERLAARICRAPPRAIVASDLERAAETANIVSLACGVSVDLDPGLREVDVGTWTGKPYDEVKRLFPEEWAAWESGLDIRRGGGETYDELALRVDAALERIVAIHSQDRRPGTVLVVSHGGAIKAWVARLLGVSSDGRRALGGVANASLCVVERDTRARGSAAERGAGEGRWRMHSWNDVAHLEGLNADEHAD